MKQGIFLNCKDVQKSLFNLSKLSVGLHIKESNV